MKEGFKRSHPSMAPTPSKSCYCPACGAGLAADARWCGDCGFTGARTLEMFSSVAPPMMPLFDAAGLLDTAATRMIESARGKLLKRFPQFRVNVWTVDLTDESSLPVFGFWLLNACSLHDGETAEDRKWTILLLLNAGTGEAAVVSGYSVESWLREPDWKWMLRRMADRRGSAGLPAALAGFYQDCGGLLRLAWRLRVSKRKSRRAP